MGVSNGDADANYADRMNVKRKDGKKSRRVGTGTLILFQTRNSPLATLRLGVLGPVLSNYMAVGRIAHIRWKRYSAIPMESSLS